MINNKYFREPYSESRKKFITKAYITVIIAYIFLIIYDFFALNYIFAVNLEVFTLAFIVISYYLFLKKKKYVVAATILMSAVGLEMLTSILDSYETPAVIPEIYWTTTFAAAGFLVGGRIVGGIIGMIILMAIWMLPLIKGLPQSGNLTYENLLEYTFTFVIVAFLSLIYENNRYKNENKLVEANDEIEKERKMVQELLYNTLPVEIAHELKDKGNVEPVFYDQVSILFADIKGFTISIETMEPNHLIKELDLVFSQFDSISARRNLEKIKTIGDAYMCAGGIPKTNPTHAIDSCLTALEMQKFMIDLKEFREMVNNTKFWEVRIGIHTGPVIAGVVGTKKYSYDMWGDTVNVASRMETEGLPLRVNISSDTYEQVKDFFDCEYRGKVETKGKGLVDMYFLNGLKPQWTDDENKILANDNFWKEYNKIQRQEKTLTYLSNN